MTAPARIPLHQEMVLASQVAAQLIAAGIDETDEHFAELMASETNISDRLVRILRAARYVAADAKTLGGMINDMQDRRSRLERKAESMKATVLWCMQELGMTKLPAPDLTATIGAGRPKVTVVDESAIPGSYFVTSRTLDKRALAAALADAPVPGADLSNGGAVLTVRVK